MDQFEFAYEPTGPTLLVRNRHALDPSTTGWWQLTPTEAETLAHDLLIHVDNLVAFHQLQEAPSD